MALTEPFDVAFPVNFYSSGDTTTEAFGKHIQEIKRIYGVINAVNADKVSAEEITEKLDKINNDFVDFGNSLQEHIEASNPHPNYKPSFNDISGKLDASRLSGQLPIRVVENGTAVVVDPDITTIFVPQGIDYSILDNNGYVRFGNGLILQWGIVNTGSGNERHSFKISFPKSCFIVVANLCDTGDGDSGYCSIYNYDKDGVNMTVLAPYLKGIEWKSNTNASYIAIGV